MIATIDAGVPTQYTNPEAEKKKKAPPRKK
jgi:hypothetical protein